ncbi:hypothetical protein PTMSG1_01150 [Pyrenophora teres f. maculata]|nr:hypothetical protein PTMSG1_01150 [Pyrenophora teres f. maculata]
MCQCGTGAEHAVDPSNPKASWFMDGEVIGYPAEVVQELQGFEETDWACDDGTMEPNMDPGANETEKGLMLTKQQEDTAKAKQAVANAMAKAKETVLVTKEALATIQQIFLTFYIPKYFLKTVNMDDMDDFDIYVFFWGPGTSVDY